jgi:hypothetical protein
MIWGITVYLIIEHILAIKGRENGIEFVEYLSVIFEDFHLIGLYKSNK